MQTRNPLLDFHPRVRSPETIWLIPIYYIIIALVLGRILPQVDALVFDKQSYFSASSAISLLSAIASGMIAFSGFVFSMLLLMVQFGSSAYTPRIARYFIQDPIVSHSLGIFTATFTYSLLALSQIDLSGTHFVPDYTVAAAMVFLLASTLAFLLLIRRTSSLQISYVLDMIGEMGEEVIETLYPLLPENKASTQASTDHKPEANRASPTITRDLPPVTDEIVFRGRPLRVVEINLRQLIRLAISHEVLIQVLPAVGDMVDDRQKVIQVRGNPRKPVDHAALRRAIRLGAQRTIEQDPKYAIRLIVDIAIRALSPAVNDPTTAVQALDQLDDLLRRIGARNLTIGELYDEPGTLRVIYPTTDWNDFLTLATDEIRHYGANSHQVMRRLRALLSDLILFVPPDRVPAIEHQLHRVDQTITSSFPDPEDQALAREPDRQGISIVK